MDITTGVVIIGVLVGAYFAFRTNDVAIPSIVVPSTETADAVVLVGAQVASTARDLRDLNRAVEKFSDVFATPAFASLQDFTISVDPEAVGRTNPFVPTDWKLIQKSK